MPLTGGARGARDLLDSRALGVGPHRHRLADRLGDLVLDPVGGTGAVDPKPLRRDVVARLDRKAEDLVPAEQVEVAAIEQDRAGGHRAGRVVMVDPGPDEGEHLGLEAHDGTPDSASLSSLAAITKSLRVRPEAAWVVSSNAARPQPSSMSGWWNSASATSAARATNPNASRKFGNSKVRRRRWFP